MTCSQLDESAAAPLASSENTSSRQWEELPSEQPLSSTRLTEDSRVWEEMPSGNPLPTALAEESRVWEEMPSENPLPSAPAAEESRVWEELPSENPLPSAPAEESRVWEELPSVNPLPDPAGVTEESRVWEELPSEYPLSVPAAAQDSLCDDLSDEREPVTDGSLWQTMASDEEDAGPGDSLDERRETPGALLGALCDELAEPATSTGATPRVTPRGTPRASTRASTRGTPRASATGASPRVTITSPSPHAAHPRSPSSPVGGGLLQAMHRQLSSPSAVSVASVAASVESYHTCYGGGGAADDSRRLTGASALSEISFVPAAPPNSTFSVGMAGDSETEDDSRLYESSVEEQTDHHHQQQQQRQPSVVEVSDVSVASTEPGTAAGAGDETTSDNCSRSPSLAGRDRLVSLASESSLAGSYISSTGSEMNDTLEMMEKLLAMEAEERRLESILQSRTAGPGETVLQDSHVVAGTEHARATAGDDVAAGARSATPAAGTPSRSAVSAGTAGKKTTPVPVVTPRGRGRPAALTPRQQVTAKSPARLATPRSRAAPSPARSAVSSTAASRLKTPTPVSRTATVAPQSTTPRTKPNLKVREGAALGRMEGLLHSTRTNTRRFMTHFLDRYCKLRPPPFLSQRL